MKTKRVKATKGWNGNPVKHPKNAAWILPADAESYERMVEQFDAGWMCGLDLWLKGKCAEIAVKFASDTDSAPSASPHRSKRKAPNEHPHRTAVARPHGPTSKLG